MDVQRELSEAEHIRGVFGKPAKPDEVLPSNADLLMKLRHLIGEGVESQKVLFKFFPERRGFRQGLHRHFSGGKFMKKFPFLIDFGNGEPLFGLFDEDGQAFFFAHRSPSSRSCR